LFEKDGKHEKAGRFGSAFPPLPETSQQSKNFLDGL
jgi:hypothetical protein